MARMIPEIIEKGNFSIGKYDQPQVEYNGYRVSMRSSFDGNKMNWIVSAMEII